jgi:hypothetical protein
MTSLYKIAVALFVVFLLSAALVANSDRVGIHVAECGKTKEGEVTHRYKLAPVRRGGDRNCNPWWLARDV